VGKRRRLASSSFEPYDWTKLPSSGSNPQAHLGVDAVTDVAPPGERAFEIQLFDRSNAAIQGDPRHDRRCAVLGIDPRLEDQGIRAVSASDSRV
jgi:hypothetical protein